MGRGPGANRNRRGLPGWYIVADVVTQCDPRVEEWLLPLPFGCGATPPGSPNASTAGAVHRFRDNRPPPVVILAVFTADGRGLAATAGFRRGVVPSCLPPRGYPGGWSNFPPAGSRFRVRAGSASHGFVFTSPWRGRSALRFFRTVRTAGPAVPGAYVPGPGRSPRPVGRANPPSGKPNPILPFRAAMEQETLRASPAWHPSRPVSRISTPFGATFRGLSGRLPNLHRLAERAFPSAQRLCQSCIPLERIAGYKTQCPHSRSLLSLRERGRG